MQYELYEPLSDIVNLMFETGTYIDKLVTNWQLQANFSFVKY